jgi:hypothetical protein
MSSTIPLLVKCCNGHQSKLRALEVSNPLRPSSDCNRASAGNSLFSKASKMFPATMRLSFQTHVPSAQVIMIHRYQKLTLTVRRCAVHSTFQPHLQRTSPPKYYPYQQIAIYGQVDHILHKSSIISQAVTSKFRVNKRERTRTDHFRPAPYHLSWTFDLNLRFLLSHTSN